MVWGKRFRALYPPDQILLAHSTDLKLFEDEKSTHNLSQFEPFSLPFGFKCLSAGRIYLVPHLNLKQNLNLCAHSYYFKLSKCKDVPIIIIIQVKKSCFLCRTVSYAWLQGWESYKGQFNSPTLTWVSKMKLFCSFY